MHTQPITLRTRSGVATGSAVLVAWKRQAYRPTHNADGRYARCIGVDADGVAYQTHSSGGWRRVDGVRADDIRAHFAEPCYCATLDPRAVQGGDACDVCRGED